MIGLLQWDHEEHGPRRPREVSILHVRFLRGMVKKSSRTPEAVLRRRIGRVGKQLLRQGVERVVLPEDVSASYLPEGLRPVSTVPLRRALAADWCGALLRFRGDSPTAARVLVTADALSGAVVRTVTELALRHRYLLLAVPYGGEELCRRLRREYGVSVLLAPTPEQAAGADLHIAFDPAAPLGGGFLPLYDETLPLPPLLLPREVEEQLPMGADRGQLIAALWEAGALRPGQVSIRLKLDEKATKCP